MVEHPYDSAFLDWEPGIYERSAADAATIDNQDLDHLWLPSARTHASGPDFFKDSALVLKLHEHAVVRTLILTSLIMLAFAAGIALGRIV
jgi:hypothetical protein